MKGENIRLTTRLENLICILYLKNIGFGIYLDDFEITEYCMKYFQKYMDN